MPVGGSIENISIANRPFSVAADADSNRKLGGFENEIVSNGDGTTRTKKTRVPWMLDGVVVNIDDENGDAEYLQNLADTKKDFDIVITYVSGIIYQGSGQFSGELPVASQATTMPVAFGGPGRLRKQN